MKKTYMTILVLLTTLVLVTAAFAKAKPKAKAKAPAPKQAAEAKETVKPGVLSYFGKVEAVDAAKKSMVVEVSVAGELTLEEKNLVFNEFLVDQEKITFDVSGAKFQGYASLNDVKKGDIIRVEYQKKGNDFIAKEVKKIEKQEKQEKKG